MAKKIFGITLRHEYDENPDTSMFGKFTDKLETGVVVRRFGKFYEQLSEAQLAELANAPHGREFRGFKPEAGGEKPGTPVFYKYGVQEYERMEALARGDFAFIGIIADAEVGVDIGRDGWKTDHITSGGLWGIESDSDAAYIKEVEREQLVELAGYLREYGFQQKAIIAAIKSAKRKEA